jgi:hypothetical protein
LSIDDEAGVLVGAFVVAEALFVAAVVLLVVISLPFGAALLSA